VCVCVGVYVCVCMRCLVRCWPVCVCVCTQRGISSSYRRGIASNSFLILLNKIN